LWATLIESAADSTRSGVAAEADITEIFYSETILFHLGHMPFGSQRAFSHQACVYLKVLPDPVAVRLAGDGALEIAVAGKPDCYGRR
jgi:hypothetical protein